MNPLYPLVALRARGRCEYCRAPEDVFNFAFEVEHLIPESRGGTDDASNLALACNACNRYKSDFMTGYDTLVQVDAPLFNPRDDVWPDHFQIDEESAEIVGLTSVGRATIMRLQMNRPRQVHARLRWIQLDLFP